MIRRGSRNLFTLDVDTAIRRVCFSEMNTAIGSRVSPELYHDLTFGINKWRSLEYALLYRYSDSNVEGL